MLKSVGTAARRQIEEFLGTKIFLGLFVKVRERWREDAAILDEMGMGDQRHGLGRAAAEGEARHDGRPAHVRLAVHLRDPGLADRVRHREYVTSTPRRMGPGEEVRRRRRSGRTTFVALEVSMRPATSLVSLYDVAPTPTPT